MANEAKKTAAAGKALTMADLAAGVASGPIELRGGTINAFALSVEEDQRVRRAFVLPAVPSTFHLTEDGETKLLANEHDADYKRSRSEYSNSYCAGVVAVALRVPVGEPGSETVYTVGMKDDVFKPWILKAHKFILERFTPAELDAVIKQIGKLAAGSLGTAAKNSSGGEGASAAGTVA